jgi:hypothetical protein
MRLKTAYVSYIDLTPGLSSEKYEVAHKSLIHILRAKFPLLKGFISTYGENFSIGFFICTKKETQSLKVLGPNKNKKNEKVEYSIFLPDEIKDLNHYIELIFEGIGLILLKYGVLESEILEMKSECIRELGL